MTEPQFKNRKLNHKLKFLKALCLEIRPIRASDLPPDFLQRYIALMRRFKVDVLKQKLKHIKIMLKGQGG